MKTVALNLLICLVTVAACINGCCCCSKATKCCQPSNQLVVKSDDGKRTISIRAENGYAGIWIANQETGRAIHLYDIEGQTALGFYHNHLAIKDDNGCDAAIGLSDKRNAFLQMRQDGKLEIFEAKDLRANMQVAIPAKW